MAIDAHIKVLHIVGFTYYYIFHRQRYDFLLSSDEADAGIKPMPVLSYIEDADDELFDT